jgi:hypothetical protein
MLFLHVLDELAVANACQLAVTVSSHALATASPADEVHMVCGLLMSY